LTTAYIDSPDNVTAHISFDTGVSAWGVDYRVGANDQPLKWVDVYLTNGSLLATIAGPHGFPGFFGFTTTAGESIGHLRFRSAPNGVNTLGFDDMAAVTNGGGAPTQVPEPSTLILLGTGVLCLAARLRQVVA
jgi:predicted dehydrogenase